MCGIVGIIDPLNVDKNINRIVQMANKIRHRGPDDEGYVLGDPLENRWIPYAGIDTDKSLELPQINTSSGDYFPIALGFRRLSILDLYATGHQPMGNPDRRYWIALNGEIYNYLELREELIDQGYQFNSSSDTEVVLKGYQAWGKNLFQKLLGMFAIVIIDCQVGKILLIRDFFGIKPLYYSFNGNQLAFASEIKALLELPWISRKANPDRLYQYLAFAKSDYGGDTFFEEIHEILPGNILEIDIKNLFDLHLLNVCYWRICPEPAKYQSISFRQASDLVREQYLKNINLHLRSDVPIGSALSGGIDSSSIISTVRYLRGPELDLHAFSYIASNPLLSEECWSQMAAESAHAILHTTQPSVDTLMEEIQNLIYCQEEPFGGLSIFAQRSVFRLAKEHHIKVLLDGQGADEVLAGYPPYISLKLLSLIRTGRWKNTYQLWSSIQNSQNNPYQDFILPLIGNLVPRRMQYTLRQFIKADISPEWLSTKWFIDRGVKVQPLIRSVRKDALRGELERAIYETSLPMLLRYEDKNSMFFSIESRVPFLTPDFVNLALSLPEEYLVDINGVGKAVFRAAMKDLVPKPILDRRDKIGFAVPENEWLRSKAQWVQAVFKSEVIHEIPILKWDKLNSIFSQMLSSSQPVSGEVWRWINVVLWADIFNVGFSS